ncbi:hypothetical protein FQA47_014031 [Oryzias melastigma]|uniref:Ig-like domain-containing protein n=1 Tax=Oryzias melastigma TaxID=30732 RepID=A0A834FM81_ORYME|nr:uncharacterized protein LOC112149513 [Oryzias melastigma]KAF6736816.1 hypothetical protein FQA47_014031 [Oryzias melastigma]
MMIVIPLTVLLVWVPNNYASSARVEFVAVELGDNVVLNCTYNCSSGFIRDYWGKESNNSSTCGTVPSTTMCTTSLCLPNVSANDLNKNYTCYTEDTADPNLSKKQECIFSLHLQVQKSVPTRTVAMEIDDKSVLREVEAQFKVAGIIIVAVGFSAVAVFKAVCFCLENLIVTGETRSLRSSFNSTEPPNTGSMSGQNAQTTQGERVTLWIPPPDDECDTEVPYADITITVRGISTPELSQVNCLTIGEVLHASRSADRLHVPREVSRKMSTTSEYAVITYA